MSLFVYVWLRAKDTLVLFLIAVNIENWESAHEISRNFASRNRLFDFVRFYHPPLLKDL